MAEGRGAHCCSKSTLVTNTTNPHEGPTSHAWYWGLSPQPTNLGTQSLLGTTLCPSTAEELTTGKRDGKPPSLGKQRHSSTCSNMMNPGNREKPGKGHHVQSTPMSSREQALAQSAAAFQHPGQGLADSKHLSDIINASMKNGRRKSISTY